MNNNIKYINESNQKSDNKKDNNDLLLKYKIADNSINKSNININNIKIKNENNYDNSGIKIILDSKFCQRPSNWNLTQKRYEKFMNINTNNNNNINNNNNNIHTNNHLINNSLNTNEMNLLLNINNSKKVHKQSNSKKHSLNEARYEKKIKNEISNHEKRRDLSAELNHINAENFINGFKGLKLKQIELLENTANNLKNNIVLTQDTQGTNTTNAYIERNKGINTQNLTINMDNNCQIETKEGDSTNFKTDQSKILKTDDIYQDLVNSLKNAPFKFKHK